MTFFKLKRSLRYEFWPSYLFYSPFIPVWLFYSLRSFNLLYFTRVNPKINFGGFFQYSKFKILQEIPEEYRLTSHYFAEKPADPHFYNHLLEFPFIYKPDIGERGKNVHLFRDAAAFDAFYPSINEAFILQEYCDFAIELGILYHRFPNGESKISSVVRKEFLSVKGDGISTLKILAENEIRAHGRLDYLAKKFDAEWQGVLPENQICILEEIGNHCRGTKFVDACDLISPELQGVFDDICQHLPDFHYGRFDLKVRSIDDLNRGKYIRIFELNGVNSEVADIYDPKHNLVYAYRKVFNELRTVYRISRALHKKKVNNPNSLPEFYRALTKHLRA